MLCLLLALTVTPCAQGQNDGQNGAKPPAHPPDQIVESVETKPTAELQEAAWGLLESAVNDAKHPEQRTQGLAAVGLLGDSPRGLNLIRTAMTDQDVDIRSAATIAAGQTQALVMTTPLRQALDDREPPVAFAAAVALWKMKDYSGENILRAVADGERSSSEGRVSSAERSMRRDLHNPATIGKLAATQGAGMLLGPFGYGITAYEYLHKNGGNVSRATAIELLAQNRTAPIQQELMAAVLDKDPGVRVAACKALSTYNEPAVSAAIAEDFDDSKPPVRFTAAASYLISTGGAPGVLRTDASSSVARPRKPRTAQRPSKQ